MFTTYVIIFDIYCKYTGLAAAANFFNTCSQTNEQTQGEIIIFVLSFEKQIKINIIVSCPQSSQKKLLQE